MTDRRRRRTTSTLATSRTWRRSVDSVSALVNLESASSRVRFLSPFLILT
jgi:hypothetical protein